MFDGDRLTLQTVRHCQQVFSAAFIAHVEAAYDDVEEQNTLCGVVPHPDSATDWIRTAYGNSLNSAQLERRPRTDRVARRRPARRLQHDASHRATSWSR